MWLLSKPHLDKRGELFYLCSCFVVKMEIPSMSVVKSSLKQCVHMCSWHSVSLKLCGVTESSQVLTSHKQRICP